MEKVFHIVAVSLPLMAAIVSGMAVACTTYPKDAVSERAPSFLATRVAPIDVLYSLRPA
jgi:hypothetical protein